MTLHIIQIHPTKIMLFEECYQEYDMMTAKCVNSTIAMFEYKCLHKINFSINCDKTFSGIYILPSNLVLDFEIIKYIKYKFELRSSSVNIL